MFQIAEANSLEELKAHRLTWDELAPRTRDGRFSQSYDWFVSYWKQASPQREMKVLVVSLAGKAIGIMPLVIKTTRTKLGNVRTLTYPLDSWGNWYGPIGPNAAATLTACLRYLKQNHKGWDQIDLPYIDRDRLDLGRTRTAMRNMGWASLERIWNHVPVIEMPDSWHEFLERKRPEVREQILLAEKELSQRGNIQFQMFGAEEESLQNSLGWQQLLKMAQKSKHSGQMEAIMSAAEREGALEIALLQNDHHPVCVAAAYKNEQGLEIIRSYCAVENAAVELFPYLESVLLGRWLEASLLRGIRHVEVNSSAQLSSTARTLWSTEVLKSYRYTAAPVSHLKGTLLLRYHQAITPRLKQAPTTKNVPTVVDPVADSASQVAAPLKIFQTAGS